MSTLAGLLSPLTTPSRVSSPSSPRAFSHGSRLWLQEASAVTLKGKKSCGTVVSCRRTLSEGWDPSCSVNWPSWMPRFEELDTTNMLLRQRIIFLGGQVETTTADLIVSQLLLLDAEDPNKDIKLLINSPGGSVTADHNNSFEHLDLCPTWQKPNFK